MRICFVGKYPPIQGGVSSESYWAVRGLAEAGHEVFVVTNAAEVEEAYRIRLEPSDADQLAPTFDNGGAVRVFHPEHTGRRLSHIPQSNPFVSKLAGLATQVIREFDCDIVVGSYFEPYGVAASMAANWTAKPVVLQHAGSDLDRLMLVPELATVYREMLVAADAVVTQPSLFGRFVGMGVRPAALRPGPPYAMPPHFSPDAVPMTVAEIDRLAATTKTPQPARPFDPGLPTIGMYGKPGVFKGSYDLIGALGILRGLDLDFNVLLLSGATPDDQLATAIEAAGLTDRTWRLPFIPHWRMGSFIRACTAVCFLERDFPVPIHGPVVPHEVLTTGTCLVLSGEIHGKQPQPDAFVDGDNLILVPDPKDRETLAKKLRTVIEQPEAAREIGKRGRLAAAAFAPFPEFVRAWESTLVSVLRGTAAPIPPDAPLADDVAAAVHWVRPLVEDAFEDLVTEFGAGWDGRPVTDAAAKLRLADSFCEFLERRGTGGVPDGARYHRARMWAMRDEGTRPHLRPVGDVLGGQEPTIDIVRNLYPLRAAPVRIERFEYDVTPLFCRTGTAAGGDGAELARGPVTIVFARVPNLAPAEMRVNAAIVALLERCDGTQTTAQVIERLLADHPGARAIRLEHDVVTAVARLSAKGVLTFAAAATAAAPLTRGR